jgi:hypothetical protein
MTAASCLAYANELVRDWSTNQLGDKTTINLLELNGARSNPRAGVELVRLGALRDELLRRALVNPRKPRPAPRHPARVLATITRVLEEANCPMRAREIHATAEQLAGEPLRWSSVKAALAAYAEGSEARFERVRRGYYRIGRHAVQPSG